MPQVPNEAPNVDLMRQAHKKNVALGGRQVGSDFKIRIRQYPEIECLVRTGQLPQEKRGDDIEDDGQFGQKFKQYGAIERHGEMASQIVEIKRGYVIKTIAKIVDNKEYVDVEIILVGEDTSEKGYLLETCLVSAEASDLDTESRTGTLRIPVTFSYNWFERIGAYA